MTSDVQLYDNKEHEVKKIPGGGGEILHTCPDRPWDPPSLLYNRYRVFPGGKERPGRDVDPSPPSSAVVKKEQSYTSTPPMGRTACTEPQYLYKGDLYLFSLHLNTVLSTLSNIACFVLSYSCQSTCYK